MLEIVRTKASNVDFIELVNQLDALLAIRDGKDHSFYHQFNGIEAIKHAVVLYADGKAIGCGAIKRFNADTIEVKRMYVREEQRGHGFASLILKALEQWAAELGYTKCALETGIKQPEAIRLYQKIIDSYPDPSVKRDQVWLRLALSYAYLGNRDAANAALIKAKKLTADAETAQFKQIEAAISSAEASSQVIISSTGFATGSAPKMMVTSS